MKYWIGVVTKDHVQRGKKGGFVQVCHAKEKPVMRMGVDGDTNFDSDCLRLLSTIFRLLKKLCSTIVNITTPGIAMNRKLHLIFIASILLPLSLHAAATKTSAPSGADFLVKFNELKRYREKNPFDKEVCRVLSDAIVHHPETVLAANEITGFNSEEIEVTIDSPVSTLTECQNQGCLFSQNHQSHLRKRMAEMIQQTSCEMKISDHKFVYVRYGVDGLFPVLQDLIHLMQYKGDRHPATVIRIVLIDEKYETYCTQMTKLKKQYKQQETQFLFQPTSSMTERLKARFQRHGITEYHDQLVQLLNILYSFCFHASLMGRRMAEIYLCSNSSQYMNLILKDEPRDERGRPIDRRKSAWRSQILVSSSHVHEGIEKTDDDLKLLLKGMGDFGSMPFLGVECKVNDESASCAIRTFCKNPERFARETVIQEISRYKTHADGQELVWGKVE